MGGLLTSGAVLVRMARLLKDVDHPSQLCGFVVSRMILVSLTFSRFQS